MKSKTLLFIATLSALIFTGCQNNDLSTENQSLKQELSKMEQQISELKQQLTEKIDTAESLQNSDTAPNVTTDSSATNPVTAYNLEELAALVDEFIASVASTTPDINNSGNLDQFFSLKRQGDEIEHALENYENFLEEQYRAGSITRADFKKIDRELEAIEETLDSACDRLEISFGIDD